MPDIRAILETMDDDAKLDYKTWRAQIRKVYVTAHTHLLGAKAWDSTDDDFLDLIDARLAVLFDRGGAIVTNEPLDIAKQVDELGKQVLEQDDKIRDKVYDAVIAKANTQFNEFERRLASKQPAPLTYDQLLEAMQKIAGSGRFIEPMSTVRAPQQETAVEAAAKQAAVKPPIVTNKNPLLAERQKQEHFEKVKEQSARDKLDELYSNGHAKGIKPPVESPNRDTWDQQ